MYETVYLILGIFLITLAAYDLLYTTFAPRGAGVVTGFVATCIWRVYLKLYQLLRLRKVMNGAGIIIIMATLSIWVLMIWSGHVLIYLSDADAVVNSTSKVPASLVERIYFVGYNLSTMGNGDFKGGTEVWLVYTAIISFSGLIMITIAITYMVPVLSAVTERRTLSIRIVSIGYGPQQMLLNNWDGESFKGLEKHFQDLAQPIARQGQTHLAYPILHYFFHSEKAVALLPNLAALDEAITILLLYVPEDRRPSNQTLVPLRQAITTFLDSLTVIIMKPDSEDEPELDISKLQEANVPLQIPEAGRIERLAKRRRTLLSMLRYGGWDWGKYTPPRLQNDEDLDLPEVL